MLAGAGLGEASAQSGDPIKIGLILPMTGPFASTGKQISAAVNLYIQQKGATVAGRRVEVILKDDTGVADVTRRMAQELIVNDKVTALAGFGLTPLALATAPLATQAKTPMVVMAAATSIITERSPFIVRTSQVVPQIAAPFGTWVAQQGMKRVVTMVSDFGPGHDVESSFSETFKAAGGQVENMRMPLQSPDFSPFLQRAADAKPDAILIFVPSGQGSTFMKQFVERGLDKSGIKLIGTGDVTDDDLLPNMGDAALGVVTAQHYSAAHDSPENKAFVEAFKKGEQRHAAQLHGGRRLRRHPCALRGPEEDQRPGRRGACRGDEGPVLDEPARADVDRSRHARHHPERLYPPGRAQGRRALQCRVRDDPQRQGSGEGQEVSF